MVTTKTKHVCPVCGEMISAQGVAGHNKSKVHLAALEQQQAEKKQEIQPPQKEEPITQKLDIKPVPSIKPKNEVKDEQDKNTENEEEWRGFFAD